MDFARRAGLAADFHAQHRADAGGISRWTFQAHAKAGPRGFVPKQPRGAAILGNDKIDTTVFIEESVHEMQIELGIALVLTAFVCWLFLGSISSTLNVVLAIPMSLLGTVAITYFLGFTLNTFTLLGLSLAVGLVVDDAVMVMENIYRHAEMGKDRVRAARDGLQRRFRQRLPDGVADEETLRRLDDVVALLRARGAIS